LGGQVVEKEREKALKSSGLASERRLRGEGREGGREGYLFRDVNR